jgi:VanZ family protein
VRFLSLWLPVVLVMGVIWQASALPTAPGPPGVPDWALHGLAYMGLSVVSVRAFAGGRWAGVTAGALASAWLLATAYGATDEWHQVYVPGRFPDLRDWAADSVGAALGAAAVGAWSIIIAARRRNHGL